LSGVSQRIHVGAGVKLMPVDEILVEAAVVDRIGVALVEVVLQREAIRIVLDGGDGFQKIAREARQVVIGRSRLAGIGVNPAERRWLGLVTVALHQEVQQGRHRPVGPVFAGIRVQHVAGRCALSVLAGGDLLKRVAADFRFSMRLNDEVVCVLEVSADSVQQFAFLVSESGFGGLQNGVESSGCRRMRGDDGAAVGDD